MIILSAIFLFTIAVICNAVMDTLTHHFDTSIFKSLQVSFWNPSVSWKNKYIDNDPTKPMKKELVAFTDAWHFFKSLTIICLCESLVLACYYFNHTSIKYYWKSAIVFFVSIGTYWNLLFDLFYNKILISKTNIND